MKWVTHGFLNRMSDSCLAARHEFCHHRVRAGDYCPAGWLGRREIRAGPLEEHSCEVRGGDQSAAGGLHAAAAAAEHCHPAAGWAHVALTLEAFTSQPNLEPGRISLSVECVELQQRCACLQQECDNLRGERTALSEKLQRLEAELNR